MKQFTVRGQQFSSLKDAASYAKTASTMFGDSKFDVVCDGIIFRRLYHGKCIPIPNEEIKSTAD